MWLVNSKILENFNISHTGDTHTRCLPTKLSFVKKNFINRMLYKALF